MGSDVAPSSLFPAFFDLRKELGAHDTLVPFGTAEVIKDLQNYLSTLPASQLKVELLTVESSIEMQDSPLFAVRTKKGASMVQGILHLKSGDLDAFVSCGNTGALVASAALHLESLPNIERPALLALLPSAKGPVVVLDVGGQIKWRAAQLLQHAQVGAAFQRCHFRQSLPRVGLLNIGSEALKGNPELRDAHRSLKALSETKEAPAFQFVGNIEGREVFAGNVDVLVTDGFTGNVFLKTSEGVASFLLDFVQSKLREEHSGSITEILSEVQRLTHHAEYPGALVSGVNGVVIKCHGTASPQAIVNGVLGAQRYVSSKLLASLSAELKSH